MSGVMLFAINHLFLKRCQLLCIPYTEGMHILILLISCIPYTEGIQFLRYEKTKSVFQTAEPETVKSLCESLVGAADSKAAAALKVC